MVIARGTIHDNKEEMLILGLSHKNIQELLKRNPIVIRRETHGDGVPAGWEIVICAGESEESIAREFQENGIIGPSTKVIRDPKLNDS